MAGRSDKLPIGIVVPAPAIRALVEGFDQAIERHFRMLNYEFRQSGPPDRVDKVLESWIAGRIDGVAVDVALLPRAERVGAAIDAARHPGGLCALQVAVDLSQPVGTNGDTVGLDV